MLSDNNFGKILFQMTKWPCEKKRKNLITGDILAFLIEMMAEASCHTGEQLMSVTEIFSVVCSLIAQAEKYCYIHAEFGIA